MLSLDSDRAQQLSGFGMYAAHLCTSLLLTLLDGFLADVLDRLPSSSTYTILYITSPREFPETDSVVYEASGDLYQDSLHMELKRDYSAHVSASSSSSNSTSLFEEYQYFTPGMCLAIPHLYSLYSPSSRYFHGTHGYLPVPCDLVYWHQCPRKPRDSLCRI